MRLCWRCNGRGWVSNADLDDGRMTGRDTCDTCDGTGKVSEGQVVEEIARLSTLRRVP